jgi:hypothetical protein
MTILKHNIIRPINLWVLFLLFASGVFGQQKLLTVKNSTSEDWKDRIVEIPWSEVAVGWKPDTSKIIITTKEGKQVPFQLEMKGGKEILNLLLQVSIKAGTPMSLVATHGKRLYFPSKTYARYVPERYDDFAWENDVMAFRAYGKALEATKENALGLDVWAKKTNELVIDKWYKKNDYHRDYGEGLDFYHVGNTLGAGNIAAFAADQIVFPANYVKYEVLDNGPLRSTFRLYHAPWKVGDDNVQLVKEIQLDAGSYFNRITATFESAKKDSIGFCIGIRQNAGNDAVMMNETAGTMGYWQPADAANGVIGIGVLVPGIQGEMKQHKGHVLFNSHVASGTPIVYFMGAAWDKKGDFKSADEWFNFLLQKRFSLQNN